jgi:cholesterol oxidase
MVGCRYDGKNTLDKNYLYLAEKRGVKILAETEAVDVRPLHGRPDGADGYQVRTVSATRRWFGLRLTLRARGVVFAGGVLGTVPLLMRLKESGSLPGLSEQLGQCVRTNSESIIGVRLRDKSVDVSNGVAIGSGVYLDEHTHVEAVRYPKDSDALGLLLTPLTNGTPGILRIFSWLGTILRRPIDFLRLLNPFGMATSTIILLVMQTLDGRIRMGLRRRWFWPFSKTLTTVGEKVPTYIPQANRFAQKMGEQLDGVPATAITEILLDIPTTAHILGGAAMGVSPQNGVIDGQNRVYGYRNLYVCDGSMVSANLGVNPSLTIAALTEQAMQRIQPAAVNDWNDTGCSTG